MFFSAKRIAVVIAAGMLVTLAPAVQAQSKDSESSDTTSRNDPARIDRDGKYICGWELMNDSERAGHKSQLYFTKDPADRQQIRDAHCQNMRKRAETKGVKLDE
jgi:hypothetical protein